MDLITTAVSMILVKSQPLLAALGVAGSVAAVQLAVLGAFALAMIAVVSLGVYLWHKPKPAVPKEIKKSKAAKQKMNMPPAQNSAAAPKLNAAKRVAIFKATVQTSKKMTDGPQPQSTLIPSLESLAVPPDLKSLPKRAGLISVYNEKCVTAAGNLVKSDPKARALILNNANAYGAGGGCAHGATAQEEDMMLCSNYYLGIVKINGKKITNKGLYDTAITTALTGSGAIITKDITAWLSDYTFEPIETAFQYDAIAMAAPNLGDKTNIPAEFWTKNKTSLSYNAYKTHMKTMIRSQIYAAIENQYTVFLPGAIGCGVFKSFEEGTQPEGRLATVPVGYTASIVASIYKELLVDEGLAQYFDHVYFPIFNGNKPGPQTSNIAIFQKAFGLTPALALHTGSTQSYAALANKEDKPEYKPAKKFKGG